MNKFYAPLVWFAVISLATQAHAGEKVRVFFLGNSYTHTNNMPKMIADIAASMGDTLVYDEHTPGGYTFQSHWSGADPCLTKIKSGNWDYVVLQEQSQRPAFGQYLAMPNHPTYTYAGQFTNLIRDSAACTTAMFYMTWGYKNGDTVNCPFVNSMCTYESMDSVLRVRYLELADSFDAVVSPVGAVRHYIRKNHPGIELYQPDESHPSVAGTYAAACSFYAALFKKDPSGAGFNSSLPAADAANIRAAAKKVVFDSLATWGLNILDLTAAYNYSVNGTQVTFTNNSSLKAKSYNWNFGDGNSSTLKDPVHTYASLGVYPVTLTTYDSNGCSRVTLKSLDLVASSIGHLSKVAFTLSPNPASEIVTIVSDQQTAGYIIRVTNAIGQTMYQAPVNGSGLHKIDVSDFSSGMYYIAFYGGGARYYDKFIKQ